MPLKGELQCREFFAAQDFDAHGVPNCRRFQPQGASNRGTLVGSWEFVVPTRASSADFCVQRRKQDHVYGYYLRDDDELMIEIKPGEFVSETAARRGLAHPNALVQIDRIKGRLRRGPRRQLSSKPRM